MRSKASMVISRKAWRVLQVLCLTAAISMVLMLFIMADTSLATQTLSLTPPLDKYLHLITYGVIGALLRLSGVISNSFLIWLLLVGVGMADELHQMHIPGRQAHVLDLIADAIGIAIGVFVMDRICRLIRVR